MRTRKEMRAEARRILANNIFSAEWLYMLLALLLAGTILSALSSVFVGIIFVGVVGIGVARATLGVVREEDKRTNFEKLFSGLTDGQLGDNIILGLLMELFIFLWSLLFIIPGIVKSYSYSMAYFIKIDNPEMSANDCITASRKMMKGHKWSLFVLDLSFIGWYILGMLALGIGVLWVDAYHNVAKAEFYEELKKSQQTAEVAE